MSNCFIEAIRRAAELGHDLRDDPPMFSTMHRQTCKSCGRTVLGDWKRAYGSALESRCTRVSTLPRPA